MRKTLYIQKDENGEVIITAFPNDSLKLVGKLSPFLGDLISELEYQPGWNLVYSKRFNVYYPIVELY